MRHIDVTSGYHSVKQTSALVTQVFDIQIPSYETYRCHQWLPQCETDITTGYPSI
jgi:hypothetical protein